MNSSKRSLETMRGKQKDEEQGLRILYAVLSFIPHPSSFIPLNRAVRALFPPQKTFWLWGEDSFLTTQRDRRP